MKRKQILITIAIIVSIPLLFLIAFFIIREFTNIKEPVETESKINKTLIMKTVKEIEDYSNNLYYPMKKLSENTKLNLIEIDKMTSFSFEELNNKTCNNFLKKQDQNSLIKCIEVTHQISKIETSCYDSLNILYNHSKDTKKLFKGDNNLFALHNNLFNLFSISRTKIENFQTFEAERIKYLNRIEKNLIDLKIKEGEQS
ncbi:MAG: hypothetical protein RSE21_00825 [Bacilli bacterium]